jgi:hypothetical protein
MITLTRWRSSAVVNRRGRESPHINEPKTDGTFWA